MKDSSNKKIILIIFTVVITALLIIGIIFGAFVMLLIKMKEKQKIEDQERQIREAKIVERAENYLENKYGIKFLVNPDGFNDIESFIPGQVEHNYKLCYEASSLEEPNFVFRVYFDIDTNNNQYSEQIRDNYCWKFLRNELRSCIENELDGILKEYKLVIKIYPNLTFNNNITPKSQLLDFLKSDLRLDINIELFTPDNNEMKGNEQIIINTINELLEESNNSDIQFTYYIAKSRKDYENINVAEEEKSNLMISQNNKNNSNDSKSSIELIKKFDIRMSTEK
ncbi:MAG: hypothetical protein E7249_19950 [Paenibacillaceae bacterium]|nr:hypothetical protein [Paenibacillaceae bacterium]